MKRLFFWLGGVLLVIVVGVGGLFLWLGMSIPEYQGGMVVGGIDSSVTIIRDEYGVPHIFAQTERDAYFAVGFVHAQDRSWQMEATRYAGAGRLTEILGGDNPDLLNSDRFVRTLGLYRRAQASLSLLSEETLRALEAYSAGVNSYWGQRGKTSHLAFQILNYEPEPWRPVDSLLWGKLLAWLLAGNIDEELMNQRLKDRISPEMYEDLFLSHFSSPVTLSGQEEYTVRYAQGIQQLLRSRLASNVWTVSGSHTVTGLPILANDPHLQLSTPILWYLVRIVTPEWTMTGVTSPSVPFHILGHNGRIAWGATNTRSDVQDFYIERLSLTDPNQYETPDGFVTMEVRTERIKVRDGEDEDLVIRETRHGTVISDFIGIAGMTGDYVLSLSSMVLSSEDTTVDSMYFINHARDWPSFVSGLRFFYTPQLHVFYADIEGNIGFISPARVPIRRRGRGRVPVPGWTGEYGWTGTIPFTDLPQRYNPQVGYILNANNRSVGEDYGYFLSDRWALGYRARRIEDHLRGDGDQHTVESSVRLQQDTVSLAALRLQPYLVGLDGVTDELGLEVLGMLRSWDGRMDRDRAEPLIYATWVRVLIEYFFRPVLGEHLGSYLEWPEVLVGIFSGSTKYDWCVGDSGCGLVLRDTFSTTLEVLRGRYGEDVRLWRWGDVHVALLSDSFVDNLPILGDMWSNRIETDGGDHTVNRGLAPITSDTAPYSQTYGAGYRGIYDLADLGRSLFMIATGQSSHPLSWYYNNFTLMWRDGEYITLTGTQDELREQGGLVFILEPGSVGEGSVRY